MERCSYNINELIRDSEGLSDSGGPIIAGLGNNMHEVLTDIKEDTDKLCFEGTELLREIDKRVPKTDKLDPLDPVVEDFQRFLDIEHEQRC